jgi:hypothetical protein
MMYIVEHYTVLTRSTATHINKYCIAYKERKKAKRQKNVKLGSAESRRTSTERRNTKKFLL